jgi:hypothetical protein
MPLEEVPQLARAQAGNWLPRPAGYCVGVGQTAQLQIVDSEKNLTWAKEQVRKAEEERTKVLSDAAKKGFKPEDLTARAKSRTLLPSLDHFGKSEPKLRNSPLFTLISQLVTVTLSRPAAARSLHCSTHAFSSDGFCGLW